MIDRATIQKVIDATDIVDVVKEFVTLKKSGANYKGLCPFHNEKTPSFTVSPSKQMCKCFSCGKGGSAITFLMEIEQMSYPEAIKWLGRKYGIEIREKELTHEEQEIQSERESMFALNDWANNYFQQMLHHNVDGVAIGMAYFRSRGFRDDTIKKFQLGYCINKRDAMAQSAISHGFNKDFLLKTGLCYQTEEGHLHDRYYGRVIFPIHNVSGRVVAFGGRILSSEKSTAKYVNSPESTIYSKSHELYGLFQAKSSIVKQDCCFLVEGYTDVISMHQSGIENVVASSGTSLTVGQAHLLHRFTENITILYDGDAAGIKASIRGIDILLAEGLNIKVLLLPDGDDPDSFSRKHRANEFQEYINTHQVDFIKFKTDLLLKDAADDPIKKANLISDIVKSISSIPNKILRQMYINESSKKLGVTEKVIVNELNRLLHNHQKNEQKPNKENNEQKKDSVINQSIAKELNKESLEEKMLISLVIRYGNMSMDIPTIDTDNPQNSMQSPTLSKNEQTTNVVQYIHDNLQEDNLSFTTPLYKEILNESLLCLEKEKQWKSLPYFLEHINPNIRQLAEEVSEERFVLSSNQKKQYVEAIYRLDEVVPRILHDFKHSLIKKRIHELMNKLRSSQAIQDKSESKKLMQEIMMLTSIERQFAQVLGDRVIFADGIAEVHER